MKAKYKPVTIPHLESEAKKYISEEFRTKLFEQIPDSSTARLQVIVRKIRANHPDAKLRPQLLQYVIGGDPKYPRCIGSMVEKLTKNDPDFPADIINYSATKKNPLLSKERESELLDLLD